MTPSKERALKALITERTKKEAAAAAGITDRTMTNYLKDPEFVNAYNAAFGLIIETATRKAQQSMNDALDVLRKVADNEAETGATRVSAARSILEYGLKLSEFNDIMKYVSGAERVNHVLRQTEEAS